MSLISTFVAQQRRIDRKEAEQEELERRQHARLKSGPDEITKKKQAVSQAQANKKTRISQRTELLELAMNWNCIDVAKELILKNSLENILVSSNVLDSPLHRWFIFRINMMLLSML